MNKFRVWDVENGRYLGRSLKEISVHDVFIGYNGDIWLVISSQNWEMLNPARYTVEFFTGLRDKNGREIYEGDRVQLKHEFGVVQFFNGQWVIMRGGILLGSVAYQADEFEIIGTVHDNSSEVEGV